MHNGKSRIVASLLSLFFGLIGIDRFYLGYTGLGVLKFCTGGGFGVWAVIDFFRICLGDLEPNNGYYLEDGPPKLSDEDAADAIRKCYSLYKSGAITEAEYEAKKSELLKEL